MAAAGLGHVPAQMVDALERVWCHEFAQGYTQVRALWGAGAASIHSRVGRRRARTFTSGVRACGTHAQP